MNDDPLVVELSNVMIVVVVESVEEKAVVEIEGIVSVEENMFAFVDEINVVVEEAVVEIGDVLTEVVNVIVAGVVALF
jgi:hypothetical protein